MQHMPQSEPHKEDGPGRRKEPNTFLTFSHNIFYTSELPIPGGFLIERNVIAYYPQLLSLFSEVHLGRFSADCQRDTINSNEAAE